MYVGREGGEDLIIRDKSQHTPQRIAEVSIEGFRSLKCVEKLQLPQLTVLIGANGVGKSSFIRFFEMLGWMLRSRNLQEFILRKGGGDDPFFMVDCFDLENVIIVEAKDGATMLRNLPTEQYQHWLDDDSLLSEITKAVSSIRCVVGTTPRMGGLT